MLDTEIMAEVVEESIGLKVGGVFYLLVIYLFADYHKKRGAIFTLVVWLFFNATIIVNGLYYVSGVVPPLLFQFCFSGSLLVYGILLLTVKHKFPNWLRIFAAANLLLLIPCIYFYFEGNWETYKLFVYILSFTPILKSFVFIDKRVIEHEEVLDD
jgi:hypothetical protein